MKRSRFSEEQIIGILREAEAGSPIKAVCAAHNISAATYHAWKRKFGGMEVSEAKRLRASGRRELAAQASGGRPGGADSHPQRGQRKKVVSPSARRRAVKMSVQEGMGKVAAACRALGLSRSSYYRSGRSSLESRRIRKEVLELSEKHPRYGYRRITALMRREGFEVNGKRVARIRREEGIKVSKKQRRMKRLGISTAERQRAERPGQVWSWDFVTDQTENGSCFRILTLLDEHTRQCLAIHPAWSIRAVDVITVVEAAIARYGVPEHLRSDNGPEFIASCMQDWLKAQEIKTLYIKPGSPWENGHIESFHDKLRDECLNRELFGNLREARVILESWRVEYNERRPHSALGYRTPSEYAREQRRTDLMGAARPQTPRRSPRQAFGGNSGSTPQGGKQTKNKTLRNPQNFSYEVSHLAGSRQRRL